MSTDITPSSAPQCPDHIVFEHVTKEFRTRSGTVRALDDVSLAIKRGSISAVIGHSGAGKSTLVRLINGLETPTRGRVLVDGTDVSQLSDKAMRPLRADIGMIFQQFNLFGSRTIYDNVAYPLKLAHWKKADEKKRITELLSFVGLTSKAWDHPDQLSGGQKQRVGIARALATKPSILLADESTSALDPETTADVLSLLKRVNAELGVTVVVITHEMEVVRSIAQQVSVLAAAISSSLEAPARSSLIHSQRPPSVSWRQLSASTRTGRNRHGCSQKTHMLDSLTSVRWPVTRSVTR